MALWRNLASLGIVMAFTATVQAQAVSLGEAPLVDSYCHVQLSMSLSGSLKLQQNGKDVELKETVTAA
ncbi:MAG TPA: hypothetical protein VE988_03660, partial [Gemmataceae bacterium]|nr:hypothetical protein [Gemmataceae bacterium]